MAEMKGFIEVTDREDGTLFLLPVSKILYVSCFENGDVFIDLCEKEDGENLVFYVRESYEKIKEKLQSILLVQTKNDLSITGKGK